MQEINFSKDKKFIFNLAKFDRKKFFLFILYSILSLGIFNLIIYWKRSYYVWVTNKTNIIDDATHIKIINTKQKSISVKELKKDYLRIFKHSNKQKLIYFEYNHHIFYYHQELQYFSLLPLFLTELKLQKDLIQQYMKGLSYIDVKESRKLFGKNLIEVEVPSWKKLFIAEILSPFFIYQICCVILWCLDEYISYAFVLLFLSFISIYTTIKEIRDSANKISELAHHDEIEYVYRQSNSNNKCKEIIKSSELVVGDLIEVQSGSIIPCDILVLKGSCILNEGMLTGESVPVLKSQIKQKSIINSSSVLLAGTQCIISKGVQRNQQAIGLVINTGFYTFKGELVRNIILEEVDEFRFHSESFQYLKITFVITLLGFIWLLIYQFFYIQIDFSFYVTMIRGLELFSTSVPPTLPLCLTICLDYSMKNLKKKNINTILINKINIAGRINTMCFDKTGTLTENELIYRGFLPLEYINDQVQFQNFNKDFIFEERVNKKNIVRLFEIFSCCHNLSLMDNQIVGDPLEYTMFQKSESILKEFLNHKTDNIYHKIIPHQKYQQFLLNYYNLNFDQDVEYEILKTFEFSSERKKSSSIFRNNITNKLSLVVKGVPELIIKLCNIESIPIDFYNKLELFSKDGYRIIGLAQKEIEEKDIIKSEIELEQDLNFEGFLFFYNPLKPQTKPTIQTLQQAGINNIMITGDYILTALNVAINSTIVDKKFDVWMGELNDQNKLEWTHFQSQEERNLRKQSGYFLKQYLNNVTTYQGRKRGYSIFEEISAFEDEEIKGQTMHILSRVQLGENIICLTGDCFQKLFEKYLYIDNTALDIILCYTKIYGRANPDQKAFIVQCLKKLLQKQYDDLFVGFCGDGANDCSALKKANIGLSLSELEASIASPFVSTVDNISTVIDLLVEGKACLQQGLENFQYLSIAALVQYIGLLFLYYFYQDYSTGAYYLMDLFTYLPITLVLSEAIPINKLTSQYPKSNIFNTEFLVSNFGILIIIFFGFLWQSYLIKSSSSYLPMQYIIIYLKDIDVDYAYYIQAYFISIISCFVYLFLALVFYQGRPFKIEWYQNKKFVTFFIFNFILQIFALFPYLTNNRFWNYLMAVSMRISQFPKEDLIQCIYNTIMIILIMFIYQIYLKDLIIRIFFKSKDKQKQFKRINNTDLSYLNINQFLINLLLQFNLIINENKIKRIYQSRQQRYLRY